MSDREIELYRMAYAAHVALAKMLLDAAANDRGEWPGRQTWADINGTSRSIFLRKAREASGLSDHDAFLEPIRSGAVDVEDLYGE